MRTPFSKHDEFALPNDSFWSFSTDVEAELLNFGFTGVVLLGDPGDDHVPPNSQVVASPTDDLEFEPINSPAYNIVFNFTDGNTSYSATANSAAAMWELIITGDLPDIGGVDDLRIDAHVGLIGVAGGTDGAGKVLANAGPRDTRSGTFLAYTGEMGIDPADLSSSGLRAIIVHEIGHVLGIPSTGRQRGLISDVGSENRWTGSGAVAEYRIISGNSSAAYVPMQDDFVNASGQTQNGGHWNEPIFGLELMTPSIDTSQFSPLSRMTLAALRDLGYTVDLGYADPFALAATPTQFRDDRSGNYNTTTTLALNSSSAGSIELAEDNDWFIVSLVAGSTYTFELTGSATGAGTLIDPFLALRAADGEVLASNNDNGSNANSRITHTAAATGQYFLDASAAGNGTGTYRVVASTGGGSVGSISIGDVTITEGNGGIQSAIFTVSRSGGSAPFTVNFATANNTATAGSDYVANSGTLSFATGVNSQTISVTINGDTLVEPNETFFVNLSGGTNGAIVVDGQGQGTIANDDSAPVAGSLSIGDVTITEGNAGSQTATFTVTRSGGTAAFSVNYASANNTASAGSDYAATSGTLSFGSGINTQTIFVTINGDTQVEPNETFFVNLSAATNGATISDGQGQGTIANDDSVPSNDDYADSFTDFTAPFGQAIVGGTTSGSLEAIGDRDWFRVSLIAGVPVTIELLGIDTSAGTLVDPYLYLYDGNANLVDQDDDAGVGLNSLIAYIPTTSGIHYISAGAYIDSYAGTYTVRVTSQTTDDYADSLADTTSPIGFLSAGGSVTGNLEAPGDRDWFRVVLTAGLPFTIDLEGEDTNAGTLSDAYLYLYDGMGDFVTSDDDSGAGLNSQLTFTPSVSGTYYVAAAAFGDSSEGTYRVRLGGNNPPAITSNGGGDVAVVTLSENTVVATNVVVADPDGQLVRFSIVGGADAVRFRINAENGMLSFVNPPNFESPIDSDSNNSYIVQVRATDGGIPSLSDTQTITVHVTDVQQFQPLAFKLASFGPGAGGWNNDDRYPRELGDVNGGGLADIVGFGDAGVFVSVATGAGSFGPVMHTLAAFGANSGGWNSDDKYPRELADVNGDGRDDIVGFGDAGVFVSLATGGGSFGPVVHRLAAFGAVNGGWNSDDRYHRELADVNGDHLADIVGFGDAGVFVSLATGGGSFGPLVHRLAAFGTNTGWFSQDRYPRHLADVNGDGMADIVGFGDAGVFVSLAIGGGSFGQVVHTLAAFGRNQSWFSEDRYPRELADVNGDGRADIVGFADDRVFVAFGNPDGSFQSLAPDLAAFGTVAGWYSENTYPRRLADINGDGAADIVGFGQAGVYSALSSGFHLI